MSGGAVEQLSRLLALIPWLVARPGVSLDEAAGEFSVTPNQLRKDLELAFMCGLPGHLPDDLIDVSLEGDRIVVSNADTIARPLRLGPDEAVALLVGLETLSQLPGVHDRELLDRVTAKIQRAAGDAADAGRRVTVSVEADQPALEVLRPALEAGRRLRLQYYVPARDEVTEREVDPIRVVVVDGRGYLEGWCRSAEAVRLFRLDRIDPGSVTALPIPAQVPPDARRPDLTEGVFRPDGALRVATLAVAPEGRWLVDSFPVESMEDTPDGGAVVRLRVADAGWLRRLVLRLGGAARVLDPPELARPVRAAALEALARYEE